MGARRRFARSAVTGLAATAADVTALTFLVHACGVGPTAANLPTLLLGTALQYAGNKHWAFEDRSPTSVRQVGLFGAVEAGTFALNALTFHLLVTRTTVPPEAARPLGTLLVYALFSYPLWARIFRAPDARSDTARTSASA